MKTFHLKQREDPKESNLKHSKWKILKQDFKSKYKNKSKRTDSYINCENFVEVIKKWNITNTFSQPFNFLYIYCRPTQCNSKQNLFIIQDIYYFESIEVIGMKIVYPKITLNF